MAESFSVLRPLDQLALRFELFNLTLETGGAGGPRVVRESDDLPAFVVVHFPPQHIGESAFPKNQDGVTIPVAARVAGPSRLAFRLPESVDGLPFSLEALLDWSSWGDLSVVPAARPRGETFGEGEHPRPPRPPEPTETAIELPYRVILSPSFLGGWAHSATPVMHQGRAELWHTRLGVRAVPPTVPRVNERETRDRDVRAVWSPDLDVSVRPSAVETSLTRDQRCELVKVSADFTLTRRGQPYRADPVAVERLMLSSTGGWLRARDQWDPPDGVNLLEWAHVATQGRDQFVRVAEAGFLYPWCHRAAQITITERVIESIGGAKVALLRKSMFLAVRQRERVYETRSYPHQGREMPFASVRAVTLFTPMVPGFIDGTGGAFWVMVEQDAELPVPFHLVGRDSAGQDANIHTAVVFVPKSVVENPDVAERGAQLQRIQNDYREKRFDKNGQSTPRRLVLMWGQPVGLAPPRSQAAPGETTLVTDTMFFDTHLGDQGEGVERVPFMPKLETAFVRVPAMQQLAGAQGSIAVQLARAYLDHGLDNPSANAAQLFAELPNSTGISLPPERAGALASLDLSVTGLSRQLGPVAGDLGNMAAGRFVPADFFPNGTKLLGAVSLRDLVDEVVDSSQFGNQVPKMVTRTTPTSVVTLLDWAPAVHPVGPLTQRSTDPGISLTVRTEIEQPIDGSPARTTTVATLRDFTFDFVGVLAVHFDALTFTSVTGRKTDVSAEINPESGVEFRGPLKFLNALRRFIPSDGFSDPPAVDVSPTGVMVGYSLPLPPLAVGVFALENVRLGASLHLPFTDGQARLRFSFGERHERFVLTVSGLGGGGFFGLALGLDGIEMIEAALEFGAHVSMNFGVASGSVTVMAGVYFRFEITHPEPGTDLPQTTVTGFVRCAGQVEVLGLISVSIELFLGLTYQDNPDRIEGEATLVIKIDLFLFSESVELTVRRSFAKAADDPGFGEIMTEDDWDQYAGAFG